MSMTPEQLEARATEDWPLASLSLAYERLREAALGLDLDAYLPWIDRINVLADEMAASADIRPACHGNPAMLRDLHQLVLMDDEGLDHTDHDGTGWHVFRCPACGNVEEWAP